MFYFATDYYRDEDTTEENKRIVSVPFDRGYLHIMGTVYFIKLYKQLKDVGPPAIIH